MQLPDELMLRILRYCWKPADYTIAAGVCRRWYAIIGDAHNPVAHGMRIYAARGGEAPVADPAALERYELGPLTAELAAILDGLRAGPEAWRAAGAPDGTMSR